MSDELYPEFAPSATADARARLQAWTLLRLVRRALANPESWVEWQREAIAVVDHIERGK